MDWHTLTRFDTDVLAKAGVRWVILLQGINDLTANTVLKAPEEQITTEQLLQGLRSLAARAHARGLKIAVGTLLPRGGAGGSRPHTPAAEAMRLAVNAWIRSTKDFDAVFDFEAAVKDPAHPDRQRPELNSGDHTHPNAAGYRAMAAAVDLRFFAPGGPHPHPLLAGRRPARSSGPRAPEPPPPHGSRGEEHGR